MMGLSLGQGQFGSSGERKVEHFERNGVEYVRVSNLRFELTMKKVDYDEIVEGIKAYMEDFIVQAACMPKFDFEELAKQAKERLNAEGERMKMEEKEKLPNEREHLEGAVRILMDVSESIRAGLDFNGIVKRWKMFNPGVDGVEECLRKVYPDELDYLVSVLKKEFSLKNSTDRLRHSAHSLEAL